MLRGRSKSFRNLTDDKLMSDGEDAQASYTPPPVLVKYPDNLTLPDLYYFIAAPTICYELNFPRTARIRTWFLIRRAGEVLVLSNLLFGLFQQWMIPSVRNSFNAFSSMNNFETVERLLKLSIPNHLMWLIWFYVVFHSFLNTVGEVMRFSDRNFYNDWWNAKDVGSFWKNWNLPVHNWCVRHLYKPVLRYGYSKQVANFLVFALSAFFHEYCVSVPLQMFKSYVFFGMVVQIPLVIISENVCKSVNARAGNILMWASLIIGQPLGIMVYFHDYAVRHIDPATLTTA